MIKSDLIKEAEERIKDLKKLQKAGLICLDGTFFPGIAYPPLTMYPPITEEVFLRGYQLLPDGLLDVYVHIPFCEKLCTFCHYPVKIKPSDDEMDYYLQTLEKEMDIYMRRLGVKIIKARSILIGGGTTTYLNPAQLKRFLDFFTARLDLSASPQFNVDLDPQTMLGPAGDERLKIMKSYGVSRLTIGVQSFDDEILKRMNRPHNAEEAVKSIERAKEAGFMVNIEFIFGYPGQTLDSWIETMKKAISLETGEIQLYRLKLIPYGDHIGTISGIYNARPEDFLSVEETILMKRIAHLILNEKGYNQTLIRVFSKNPKIFSRYAQSLDWTLQDIISFGQSAFSSFGDRFSLNTPEFKEYYSHIEQGKLPINRGLVRIREDQIRWALALPLRCKEVNKAVFKKQTGVSLDTVFRKKIEKLKKFNLACEDDKVLKLTELGRFFADEISFQFYHPDYIPFPKTSYAEGELNPFNDSEL